MHTQPDTPDRSNAVEVRDLVKVYPRPGGGSLRAVDGISFEVGRGEFFGFLGPNGAGKTTALEIIEGIRTPSAGQVRVLGLDVRRELAQVKRLIGVQLQAASYFSLLTIEEILELFGSFYPKRRTPAELLATVGLADRRKAYLRQLSGGQQHRFSVAAALVNDPEVLFLDEPTTGLDPQMRHSLWDVLRRLNREEGKTIVLTTHYIEEAELLADRVAVIDHGRIVALDTPAALIERHARGSRVRFGIVGGIPRELGVCRSSGKVYDEYRVTPEGAPSDGVVEYEVPAAEPTRYVAELAKGAGRLGLDLRTVQVRSGSLEDVFLALTGRELRD